MFQKGKTDSAAAGQAREMVARPDSARSALGLGNSFAALSAGRLDLGFDTHLGIFDYREATLKATPDEIKAIAEFFLHASEASFGRAALLATGPTETALNQIFASRMSAKNALRVFSTWEAACAFVGISNVPDPMA